MKKKKFKNIISKILVFALVVTYIAPSFVYEYAKAEGISVSDNNAEEIGYIAPGGYITGDPNSPEYQYSGDINNTTTDTTATSTTGKTSVDNTDDSDIPAVGTVFEYYKKCEDKVWDNTNNITFKITKAYDKKKGFGEIQLIGNGKHKKYNGTLDPVYPYKGKPYVVTSISKKLKKKVNDTFIPITVSRIPSGAFAKRKSATVTLTFEGQWTLGGEGGVIATAYREQFKKYEAKNITIEKNAFKNTKKVTIEFLTNPTKKVKFKKGAFKGVKHVHLEFSDNEGAPSQKTMKKIAKAVKAAGAKKITYRGCFDKNGKYIDKIYTYKAKKKK